MEQPHWWDDEDDARWHHHQEQDNEWKTRAAARCAEDPVAFDEEHAARMRHHNWKIHGTPLHCIALFNPNPKQASSWTFCTTGTSSTGMTTI